MKVVIIALTLLLAINCKKITKEIVDELIKPYFDAPANFTTLYKNLQCPFVKYTYGIPDETSLGQAITILSLKNNELKDAISFFEEMKWNDNYNHYSFDCKINKEKTGGDCSGIYAHSISYGNDTHYYVIAKYENATFEFNQYKTEQKRVCKSPRKYKFEYVKVPVAGYSVGNKVLLKGIQEYVMTQVYGAILKNL